MRVFSDTYWVGTEGLGSILITSEGGHILIDGGLPASVPLIRDNIQALGFRLEDVRLIVTSHAHFDHVGGVAALQRASGAEVAATKPSAATLKRGAAGPDDPQFGEALDFPPVRVARVIEDGDTLRAGDLALVAHITAGHTPGGTSWSWMSCEEDRCLEVVYADSQTPISADGFLFSQSSTYPTAVEDFRRGQERLASLRCDILLTPHPGASAFWKRVAARTAGDSDALVDGGGCHRYAETAKRQLERRLEQEGPDDVPKGPPQVVGSPGPNSRRR